ncbi:diphthine synthase [uncultured Methanolobus sp.]|uniref:diphthine synthase n=1 Tax=uncultured Methanolobus sp. TaxID=218300 RepID=UPI0029C90C8B|nr:diphthine synthase [uncultured Methanolobus sp.]
MLTFIGLGLFDEKDISLKGLEAIKNADMVFAEFYTSCLMGSTIEELETLYGKTVNVLSREDVEISLDWLAEAKEKNVVFLTGGDTMVSTTHVDLRLRAKNLGIGTRLIHGSSIASAICGLSGLQNYRFGKASTIPHPYTSIRGNTIISETPYDTIKLNKEHNMHTLVFLDIDKDKGYMTVNQALGLLLEIERRRGEGVMENAIVVGIARAGSDEPVVKAGYAHHMQDEDFGEPLHILVVPASLHFIEAEALVKLLGAPQEILDELDD